MEPVQILPPFSLQHAISVIFHLSIGLLDLMNATYDVHLQMKTLQMLFTCVIFRLIHQIMWYTGHISSIYVGFKILCFFAPDQFSKSRAFLNEKAVKVVYILYLG